MSSSANQQPLKNQGPTRASFSGVDGLHQIHESGSANIEETANPKSATAENPVAKYVSSDKTPNANPKSPEINVISPTESDRKHSLSFTLKNPKHSLKLLAAEMNSSASNNGNNASSNHHFNQNHRHSHDSSGNKRCLASNNESKHVTGSAISSTLSSPAPSIHLAKVASRGISVSGSRDSVNSDSESDSDDVWLPLDRESTKSIAGNNSGNSDGESSEDEDENDPKYMVGNINFYDLQEYIEEERKETQRLWLKNKRMNDNSNDINNNSIVRKLSNKQKYQSHEQVIPDSSRGLGYKRKHNISKAALKYVPKWAQIHPDPLIQPNMKPNTKKKLISKKKRSSKSQQVPINDSSSEDDNAGNDDDQHRVVGFAEKMNRVEDEDEDKDINNEDEQDDINLKYRHSQNTHLALNNKGKLSSYGSHYTDIELQDIPNRFSLFTSKKEETIHAPNLPGLIKPGELISDLFRSSPWKVSKQNIDVTDSESVATSSTASSAKDFVWWLDCNCANDSEIKILAKTFGVHPLTTEDIRVSENREKVEFFKNYYFVSFHSFDANTESEEYLEPVHFYMVVFANGFLSFHNDPTVNHSVNVRRRIRQLGDYVPLSSDWICYALIDDITDSFLPVIEAVDYETDALESSVFDSIVSDFKLMLERIGKTRNEVMKLVRLLGSKADVIRMLYKRSYNDYLAMFSSTPSSIPAITNVDPINSVACGNQIMPYAPLANTNSRSYANLVSAPNASIPQSTMNAYSNVSNGLFDIAATEESFLSNSNSNSNLGATAIPFPLHQLQNGAVQQPLLGQQTQTPLQNVSTDNSAAAAAAAVAVSRQAEKNQIPRADIALYLGDIQDHIITMNQNLVSYEKILARVYTNYLAQLQVESVNSNNKVNEILSRVTLLGTVLVPLNVITGLFGMNVKIPGEGVENLGWFFGVIGMLIMTASIGIFYSRHWFANITAQPSEVNEDSNANATTDGASFLSRFRRSVTQWGTRQTTNNLSNDANRSMVSFSNYT